jgi:hypothetical protein
MVQQLLSKNATFILNRTVLRAILFLSTLLPVIHLRLLPTLAAHPKTARAPAIEPLKQSCGIQSVFASSNNNPRSPGC